MQGVLHRKAGLSFIVSPTRRARNPNQGTYIFNYLNMLWLEVVTGSSKGSQRGQGQEVTSHAGVVLLNHSRIVRDAFDLLYFKKSKYFSSTPGSVAFLCLGYGNNRLEHPEFRNCLPHGIAGCRFMMVRSMFDAGRSCIQEEVNPSLGLSKLFVHPGCVMMIQASYLVSLWQKSTSVQLKSARKMCIPAPASNS